MVLRPNSRPKNHPCCPGSKGEPAYHLCVRAYVVNEERTYMNSRPGHDTLIALLQQYKTGKITPRHFSEMLKLMIEACNRIPQPDSQGRYQADLRLFLNGYVSNLIENNGWYQARLTFLKIMTGSDSRLEPKPGPRDSGASGPWEVEIEGKNHPCTVEEDGGRFHVVGPKRPLSDLVTNPHLPRFLHGGVAVGLVPISRLDRPSPAPLD